MPTYNAIATMQRLEDAGLARPHAVAIASEIGDSMADHVTHEQLRAAMDRQTIRLGVLVSGVIILACTVLGVILSK